VELGKSIEGGIAGVSGVGDVRRRRRLPSGVRRTSRTSACRGGDP
jgi:hypothetical protein